ncbi:ImmA/IrrE family metallo-endopeptidase [Cohnella sp. GCM10012308]|uniref:ImmA/IrrE family metallo-endopeptidase n=1 Tax=Cohnella sp. GCM10012308 TaxID=3317329 RepID=UPI0036138EB2
MGFIRDEVRRLTKSTGTSDPLQITAQKNILVLYEALGNFIWGYFTYANRIPIIHINNKLSELEAKFTVAHELGHYVLHPRINTPFLRRNTLMSVDRIERQANQFAIKLLTHESTPRIGQTYFEFLTSFGIPEELHDLF